MSYWDVQAHIVKDPIIKQRVIQLAVGFAIGPLKRNAQFAFKLFDYILDTRCPAHPACEAYTDAVRDLQAFSLHQLQRLAMRFPNDLVVSGTSKILGGVLTYNSRPYSTKWRGRSCQSVSQ